jgi:acetolactate synthase small subunit
MTMHTFTVYVEDRPGVLNRVASLFRRRGFNITSLAVGHSETPGVSRMTVVVQTDAGGAQRIEAHLYKLIHVIRVGVVVNLRHKFLQVLCFVCVVGLLTGHWKLQNRPRNVRECRPEKTSRKRVGVKRISWFEEENLLTC